jgi:hypothetical protein
MWKLVNQAQQAVAAAGFEEHLVRLLIGTVKAYIADVLLTITGRVCAALLTVA